ncbi:hypothetical protein F5Y10DRAFT_85561 [Nemania abortiva]|nr:hypothetical protein F5Y10DRAFT_85561 [Nemania abortiva]
MPCRRFSCGRAVATSSDVLLEQLKNLLPVAKQASTDLAKHQQRHGLSHEPGMHDNVMLEISKEIQRQIAHAIKPHLRPGTTEGRFPGPRRRERRRDSSIIDEADFRRRWASPSRRSGSDADSVGDGPRRTAKNRVSFQTATNATEHDAEIGHNGIVAQTVDSHEPQSPDVQIPSPPADDTGHTVEPESDEAWFGRARRIRANELVQEDRNSQEHSQRSQSPGNHWALDISDPTKPRIHQCRGPCVDEHCSSCGQTHCIRDHCRSDEQTAPKEGKKILDDNVPRELSPLPEPEKPITSTGSSHKEAIPPQEARVKHSPSLTAESEEQSGKSDKGVSSLKNGSSRTSLAPPSSKSSNPSVGRPRSPDAKERHSTGLRVVTNEVQEMPDPSNGVPDVPKTESQPQSQPQPQPQPEPEQKPEQDNHAPVQEGPRRLEGLEIWNKQAEQRRRRRSRPVSYQSHVSDGSDAGSGKPSPYVPVPPFGGQGSRRRPRRPRSTVSEEPEQGAV